MDLAAAFLLSLLGGYCFAHVWRGTRFTTRRVDGHHLYFRAALCGAILFSIALALRIVLVGHFSAYRNFDSTLVEYVRPVLKVESGLALAELTRRAEWVVTAIYSLLLGAACGPVSNVFTPRRWAQQRSISALYMFLLQSRQESFPVSLTLKTSKVYIGNVVATLDPIREPVVVPFLPILSGHRDPEGRLNLQRIAQHNQTAPPQELIVQIRRPKRTVCASDIKVRHAAP